METAIDNSTIDKLLEIAADTSSLDKLWNGTQIVIAGMVVVCIGLIVVIALLRRASAANSTAQAAETAAPVFNASAPVYENISLSDNGELVAVITAAVACYAQPGKIPVVRSVQRVSGRSNAWARAGREQQLNNRL